MQGRKINPTPLDSITFGFPTYELLDSNSEVLKLSLNSPGHYTIKVDPLSNKSALYEYGFYYCDTLIEPTCLPDKLRSYFHPDFKISKDFDAVKLLAICDGAFSYGRFHRDFNISKEAANLRYLKWLKQLIEADQVYGLYWQDKLAGFIGVNENNLVLHAIAIDYRAKGFSKYWWSAVCRTLFTEGHKSIHSSISASNLAVINLYSSLGFTFKNARDVYHRWVP
jgi:hypothetical protein